LTNIIKKADKLSVFFDSQSTLYILLIHFISLVRERNIVKTL